MHLEMNISTNNQEQELPVSNKCYRINYSHSYFHQVIMLVGI